MGLKYREGQPGAGVEQEVVTGGKLELAQAAAAFGVTAADWQAITQWYELVIRVRSAYYEVLTAERELGTNQEIVRIAQEGLDKNDRLAKARLAGERDVIGARLELTQSQNRLQISQQRRAAAWKLLATAVGVPALPACAVAGALDAAAPTYEWDVVLAGVLGRSSEIQEAQANLGQAHQELRLARAQVVPNVKFGLQPAYDVEMVNPILTASAQTTLPIFNRNQGNILAAQAEVARSTRVTQQVQLRLTERLIGAFQRYENAQNTLRLFESKMLPDAERSLALIRIGFDGNDPKFDFNAVLDAQRTLAQTRLAVIQAQGELWQSVSILEGLLQREPAPLPLPCAAAQGANW
jgi:cobalt-zinc-cadmium efflux system outer membrane protein